MNGLMVWKVVERLQDRDMDTDTDTDTDVMESSKKLQFEQKSVSHGGSSLPQEQMIPTSIQKET